MIKLICPNEECKKELDEVNVYSQCVQKAVIENGVISDYDSVDEILETQDIECPHCGASLMSLNLEP